VPTIWKTVKQQKNSSSTIQFNHETTHVHTLDSLSIAISLHPSPPIDVNPVPHFVTSLDSWCTPRLKQATRAGGGPFRWSLTDVWSAELSTLPASEQQVIVYFCHRWPIGPPLSRHLICYSYHTLNHWRNQKILHRSKRGVAHGGNENESPFDRKIFWLPVFVLLTLLSVTMDS